VLMKAVVTGHECCKGARSRIPGNYSRLTLT
jgi:hypothetical protein